MNSNTTEGRPADLTVRGGIASLAGTLVFIFGGLAIEYVKSHSPDLSYSTKIVLAVLDVVVVCGVLGYLFLEAARMWDRFSYFVERVTTSSTWPRVKPAVGLAASALSVVILISIGLVAIVPGISRSSNCGPKRPGDHSSRRRQTRFSAATELFLSSCPTLDHCLAGSSHALSLLPWRECGCFV